MNIATLPPPPRETANPAPVRSACSVRRTSSIDVSWPDGQNGDRLFVGRARDYLTPASGGAGKVLGEAELRARLDDDKSISSIEADPAPAALQDLVGQRAGGHLRIVLRDLMPELLEEGAPLYLALDDLSGTALVSAFAWSQWYPDWTLKIREKFSDEQFQKMMTDRVNICWGLAEGNSGVSPEGPPRGIAEADAGDLRNPEDPEGWHELFDAEGPGFRRARRIDVTRDDDAGLIRIESAFQDSAKRKEGGRVAIHEYNLSATADLQTGEILTLEPEARILPFSECPGAVRNTQRLVGLRIDDIRDEVLAHLRGTQGCTHLNDALRALAEVPKLAGYLE
jgi:hypothetical protein